MTASHASAPSAPALNIVGFTVRRLRAAACGLFACPHCDVVLCLHQPDIEDPGQMLGTCDQCSGWFILVGLGTRSAVLAFEVPRDAATRAVEVFSNVEKSAERDSALHRFSR